MSSRVLAALAGAAALLGSAAQAAAPCFFVNEWRSWKAPNDHTLYLGVNLHEVYEVDLSGGSPMLQEADAHLINVVRGPTSVCSPLDLQLAVADQTGIKVPLIAARLRKLTPDEIAAIPKRYRPF